MNSEIILEEYSDPTTSHELERSVVYENGQIYERHYEYADMEPFDSTIDHVIQNFVIKDNYVLKKCDLTNGIVTLERGKDKVLIYPNTKEVEIFEYKRMRTE